MLRHHHRLGSADRGRRARILTATAALAIASLATPATVHARGARARPDATAEQPAAEKAALVTEAERARPRDGGDPIAPGNAANLCFPLDSSYTQSMPPNDDGSSGLIPLPFTFNLYGDTYTDLFINNNGNVSFVQPFFTFTSVGFPSTQYRMVAPFWADVDTRGAGSGLVYHKVIGTNTLVVTWDNVGYYDSRFDKLNTFQVALSDGTNPDMGLGNNVCFCYDDMAWTTGSASGGNNGFGGTPATVGANRGNGIDFFQIGRFDHAGIDYDGPFGNADGVSYLDGQHICFNTSTANIAPIPTNLPPGDEIQVECGQSFDHTIQFLSPEAGQTTTVTISDPDGAQARGLVITNTPGNTAVVNLTWAPDPSDVGTYVLTFTATDDFVPPGSTTVSITIIVTCPNQPPSCDTGGPYTSQCWTAVLDAATASDPDDDPIVYTWSAASPLLSFNPASGTLNGTGAQPVPPTTVTLDSSALPCNATFPITLGLDDGRGGLASCSTDLTFSDTTDPELDGVPPDLSVECDQVPQAPPVTATDNCDPAPSLSFTEQRSDGTCASRYTLTRTWTSADHCGNALTRTQVVTVDDTTAPVPLAVLLPLPPTPPHSAAPPRSACVGPTSARFQVQCSASDNCDSAPAVSAVLHVVNHDVPTRGGPCVERTEDVPVACGEIVEIRLLPPPCPARPPRSSGPPAPPNSQGFRVIAGEEVTLVVTAEDHCGNSAEATADPTDPPSDCTDPLPDGTCCPVIERPPDPRCSVPVCLGFPVPPVEGLEVSPPAPGQCG